MRFDDPSLVVNIKQAFPLGTALMMVLSTISGTSASAAGPNVLPDEASWYRKQLIDGEVKPRLQYGLAPNGFYRPHLARDWQPKREQKGTLVSQTSGKFSATQEKCLARVRVVESDLVRFDK